MLGSSLPITKSLKSILDTGSTAHFFPVNAKHLKQRKIAIHPLHVHLADDSTMSSTHTAELPFPWLPRKARVVHLFPALGDIALLSVSQLVDNGCEAHFDADKATITFHGKPFLQGQRCPTTRLWLVSIPATTPTPAPAMANTHTAYTATLPTKAAEMVAFSHATLFSPTLETLQKALGRGYITGFPGLSTNTLTKYPPSSIAMHKGHLDQARANQRSTKEAHTHDTVSHLFPTVLDDNIQEHHCFCSIHEYTGKTYSDQTGRFPVTSTRGNKYLFIFYSYDTNLIYAEPMKSREAGELLRAFTTVTGILTNAGFKPCLHTIDNECPQSLTQYMYTKSIDFQRTPPGIHRRNAGERAIRTYKNHLIAGLATTHPDFPLSLWDYLIEQSNITINLLRGSRMNPKLSAYAQIFGPFDFNKNPLAPPGTHVLAHEKPTNRKTWDPKGQDGWYVGPAMESYRCYKVWIWQTRGIRTVDTLSWFPHNLTMPSASALDILHAATQDILSALTSPHLNSPLSPLTTVQSQTLQEAITIFQTSLSPPTLPSPDPQKQVHFDPTFVHPRKTTLRSHAQPLRVPPATTHQSPASVLRVPTFTPPPLLPPNPIVAHPPTNPTPAPSTVEPLPGQSPDSTVITAQVLPTQPVPPPTTPLTQPPPPGTNLPPPTPPAHEAMDRGAPPQLPPAAPSDTTNREVSTPLQHSARQRRRTQLEMLTNPYNNPPALSTTPAVITQEEDSTTQDTTDLPQAAVNKPTPPQIIGHRKSTIGGAYYEVQVQCTDQPTSFQTLNKFTESYSNPETTKTAAEYAQTNNLLKTKGWKQLQHHLPSSKPSANIALTRKQRNFFEHTLPIIHRSNKAIHPDTGKLVEYPALLKSSDGHLWEESNCEEIGRLAQGYLPTVPTGTNTLHFIRFDQIPGDRRATYLRLVVADRPMKTNPRRVRWTVGGDQVDYPGDVNTKTADLTSAKILINSVLSTSNAKFMCLDLKDFYLNADMDRPEYMRIPLSQIPQKMIDLYNLQPLIHKGAVYVEINKSMYGLPQAGRISNHKLVNTLEKAGFVQSTTTPGLFKHTTRPLAFCLVVDDFGVKFVGKEHVDYLITILEANDYKLTTDWEGKTFVGLNLDWDYNERTCTLSMPGYVEKALARFTHPTPVKPEHSPHDWTKPQYGAKIQMTKAPDTSPHLDDKGIKRIREIVGVFLYYARAVDNTMLVALGSLAAAQSKGTQATAEACTRLLNYAATHPDAKIKFHASDMILTLHSDASYLSETEARSRAGGFFYLGNQIDTSPTGPPQKINGPIHINSKIMHNVLASATEAEVGALFHNAQDAAMIRETLQFLGHTQPPTPIQTDNSCAEGIVNDTVKQKRSKAIDMRFYWVRDRVRQGQFVIFWRKGQDNLADYFTKHFPPKHHQDMRPIYLYEEPEAGLNDTALCVIHPFDFLVTVQ